jgi:RNase adapter protein RapZ
MRWLPNPYWIPDLRGKTGRSADVSDYVLEQKGARDFVDAYVTLLSDVAEGYLTEGKRFMSVAIGCTGGKHRSVAMSEEVGRRMREAGYDVVVVHRDLGRE